MSNLEHLIENSLSELEKFVGSGEDVNVFNEHWRESIVTDPNYEGINISPEDIMEICVYFLFTWCQYCDKRSEKVEPMYRADGKYDAKLTDSMWVLADFPIQTVLPISVCNKCGFKTATRHAYCPGCGRYMINSGKPRRKEE